MHGFFGRILTVDLSCSRFQIKTLSDVIYRRYLGGKGLGAYLLYRCNPAGIDPLSPNNHLIFATGPFCGTPVWGSSRYGVFTKSPQTGFFAESYAGGKVPLAMVATGFDAVVIRGRSPENVLLEVHPDGATFHAADRFWGLDAMAAEDAVHSYLGKRSRLARRRGAVVIGPAGEAGVRFALIANDYWRSAGRTGAGAVMGGKRLKAIFFHGNLQRSVFDRQAAARAAKALALQARTHAGIQDLKRFGTPRQVKVTNDAGAFPTRYWQAGRREDWHRIGANALHARCDVTPNACAKCFVACGRLATVTRGRYAGLRVEGPEYETIFAFGGLCLVDSIEEILFLNDLCDRLGMDTISAGNLCGFTIEAVRRGRVAFDIDYGDTGGIVRLLNCIARREGIGDVLAEGIRQAARAWDLEDLAVHVKGMEPPGYDPRQLKGSGLAFAVSSRGACHLRANFHNPELKGVIDPQGVAGKTALFIDLEDRLVLMDAFILCRFFKDLYPWDKMAAIYHFVTGCEQDRSALQTAAGRICSLVRLFNLREGLQPGDDDLPAHFYKHALPNGCRITPDELAVMRADYYHQRGWDADGRVLDSTCGNDVSAVIC